MKDRKTIQTMILKQKVDCVTRTLNIYDFRETFKKRERDEKQRLHSRDT